MPSPHSKFLSALGFRGLNRLGDAICPGDGEFPAFSALGCAEQIDQVLDYLPAGDRGGLTLLLAILGCLPRFVVRGLMRAIDASHRLPGPLGGPLRFLRMGLKGLIFTLYYSGQRGHAYQGPSPHDVLGYQVGVYTSDLA